MISDITSSSYVCVFQSLTESTQIFVQQQAEAFYHNVSMSKVFYMMIYLTYKLSLDELHYILCMISLQ